MLADAVFCKVYFPLWDGEWVILELNLLVGRKKKMGRRKNKKGGKPLWCPLGSCSHWERVLFYLVLTYPRCFFSILKWKQSNSVVWGKTLPWGHLPRKVRNTYFWFLFLCSFSQTDEYLHHRLTSFFCSFLADLRASTQHHALLLFPEKGLPLHNILVWFLVCIDHYTTWWECNNIMVL